MDTLKYIGKFGSLVTAAFGLYLFGKTCYILGVSDTENNTERQDDAGFHVKRDGRKGFKVVLD